MDELGYDVEWEVLNSKHFGVPQNRERIFIIGHIRGEPFRQIFPIGETDKTNNVEREYEFQKQFNTIRGTQSQSSNQNYIIQAGIRAKGNPRFYEDTFPTIGQDAGTGGGNVPMIASCLNTEDSRKFKLSENSQQKANLIENQSRIRRLTPIECERLQSFSDRWTQFGINEKGQKVEMSDTQRYKMMGNAVTVNVIQAIAERL